MFQSSYSARRWGWISLGASPYLYSWAHMYVALIAYPMWPGHVKGMLLALPDVLAVSLLLSTKAQRSSKTILISLLLFIALSSVSVFYADAAKISFFWIWQLLRVCLVSVAVARICLNEKAPRYLVSGLCIGITFQAAFSVYQRLHGVIQADGTMGHQNLLGMMTHFALLLSTALILAGDRRPILKLGVASAVTVVVLSGSRGTLGFALGGSALLLLLTIARRPSPRKFQLVGAVLVAGLLATPVALITLRKRFEAVPISGTYDERAAFERAAKAVFADNPMGVGGNEYVVTANTRGYSQRAGVAWNAGSRSANVHNAFLLIAAETGWLGLFGIVTLFATAICVGLYSGWALPSYRFSDLLLGGAVTLITVAAHNNYEWVFVSEPTQYLFGMTLGLISGLASQRKNLLARLAAERRAVKTKELAILRGGEFANV